MIFRVFDNSQFHHSLALVLVQMDILRKEGAPVIHHVILYSLRILGDIRDL